MQEGDIVLFKANDGKSYEAPIKGFEDSANPDSAVIIGFHLYPRTEVTVLASSELAKSWAILRTLFPYANTLVLADFLNKEHGRISLEPADVARLAAVWPPSLWEGGVAYE